MHLYYVSRCFEHKSTLRVEKIFAHLLSTISLKKIFPIFSSSQIKKKIAYTKMYRTQKLINQFLNQVEYPI